MDRSLDTMLALLVEEIERVEDTRKRFGTVFRQIKEDLDLGRYPALAADALETKFSKKIDAADLSGLRVAGIDGGLIRRRFRSMDLIITRGVAVVFQFGPKEGPSVDFFPSAFPEPKIRPVMLTLPGPELDQLASLERVAAELRVTLSILDDYIVDLILVDGSLIYHPRDRPNSGSAAYEKFQEVIALYRQLYNKTRKKGTNLVGVVKDSRSTRVVNILSDILPHVLRNPNVFE
ncbi:MAG: DNA double-strand break repair nuclease NurA, partial [Candidatus Thorarchaeota archaeon]